VATVKISRFTRIRKFPTIISSACWWCCWNISC